MMLAENEMSGIVRHFTGCLLGGAAGDALGAPIEFMQFNEIEKAYGSAGIKRYAECYGSIGTITDDTQMTLFTAEGLLQAELRWRDRGICHVPSVLGYAYLNWLTTQGETNLRIRYRTESQLLSIPELHSVRAPGATCLSALKSMPGIGSPALNNSKGCGGVMRVAPIGLMAASRFGHDASVEWAFRQAIENCGLTHGHPSGQYAGGALAVIIAALVNGLDLNAALDSAETQLASSGLAGEVLDALTQARMLAVSRPNDYPIPAELGEGWVAEESLAIAVYCCISRKTFEDAVVAAVNHSGDSDSCGAIAGNIMGALHGVDAIPEHFLLDLELRNTIEDIAIALWRGI